MNPTRSAIAPRAGYADRWVARLMAAKKGGQNE